MDRYYSRNQYNYLIFLAVLYFAGWAATYPMVYRIVEVHGIIETGAIFLFPLSYAVADVITEIYGYRVAKQVVWSALICGFIYSVSLKLVISMHSINFTSHNELSYEFVFSKILRAYLSLTAASLIGNFINIYIMSKWKIYLKGKHFWFRSLLSTCLGELTFTLIGGTLAYTGIETPSSIFYLMLNGYIFKIIYALIIVWPAFFLANLLKHLEGTDVYDYNISYNPFRFAMQ